MKKNYLGIDLGGTGIKMAIVEKNGKIVEQMSFPNSCPCAPKTIVNEIRYHLSSMKHAGTIVGAGVGVAGDVDQKNGIVRFSPNLGWKMVPLKHMLKAIIKVPIIIDNDANAAAWGAYWLDAKASVKNLICITLGTGVGGGIICDGKLYRGATGTAGEIGHIAFDAHGLQCNCGSTGCIERYLGAKFLSMQAQEAVERGKSKIISKLTNGNLEMITPKVLTQAANQGDKVALSIWHQAGERLGIILAGVINMFNPEMIILAGGVSSARELLLKPIRHTVTQRAFKAPAQACDIIISHNNQAIGVVGAALLAR